MAASQPDTLHLVCPHCDGVNRLPRSRLADRPQCGSCSQPLFDGHPVELDDQRFERHIGRNDIPVVVDFWAPWCGPCRAMAPEFERTAAAVEPRVRLAKLNTEEAQRTAARFGIRSIPTLVMFRGGRELARQSGAMPASALQGWIRQHA